MIKKLIRYSITLGIFFIAGLISSSPLHAAPIGAKAVLVEGVSHVISIKDSKRHVVKLNRSLYEGDRIITSNTGIVEVRFDTGDLIRIDKGTDMIIKSLRRNKRGSTFSVFGLLFGRIKSAVTKLVSAESKFEYHTKTAIAGVSGTPPFIVGYFPDTELTEVDLLGKKGEHGELRVRGLDPRGTAISLFSGFRTTVGFHQPPRRPFTISPQRFTRLNRAIPFRTRNQTPTPQGQQQGDGANGGGGDDNGEPGGGNGAPGPGGPGPNTGGNMGENLAVNNLAGKVSKPTQASPKEAQGTEAVGSQPGSGQGAIGQSTQGSSEAAPPPATVTIDIRINLK